MHCANLGTLIIQMILLVTHLPPFAQPRNFLITFMAHIIHHLIIPKSIQQPKNESQQRYPALPLYMTKQSIPYIALSTLLLT